MGMARDFTDFLSFRLTVLKSFVMPYKLTVLKKEGDRYGIRFWDRTDRTHRLLRLDHFITPKKGCSIAKGFHWLHFPHIL